MSTERRFEEILHRVETGLTTCYDSVWLRQYFEMLHSLVDDYKNQLDRAQHKVNRDNVLVDPDWRFGGDEYLDTDS